MVCSSQTSVATLLLQWCLPTAVTVCWCCTQCQNTQILLLTGGLFLYWSNTPRSHGSNRTAWLQRKARGFKISFNRAKLSYNHNVSKYNTLTKVKQIPDRIEKNIIPQFHDWTTEHSLFFTLTQRAESDLDTLGLSRKPRIQTDVLYEFWFPWHFGKISMLCLPWKYYRKPRVPHESPITALGFLFTVEIMWQQHFPLIMNQFSANRPMWGISLYMKIPWFNKSASYAQSIKLNQNKDFNLPKLTQT